MEIVNNFKSWRNLAWIQATINRKIEGIEKNIYIQLKYNLFQIKGVTLRGTVPTGVNMV